MSNIFPFLWIHIGDKYGPYLKLWSGQIIFHVVYPELFIDLNKFGNLEKIFRIFQILGKKYETYLFKYKVKYVAERGTLVVGKFITFIIFALKVSDFVGASVPY